MAQCNTTAVLYGKQENTGLAIPLGVPNGELTAVVYIKELKALRKRRGYSQAKLAELVGVEQPTVQRWEKGTRMPDLESLDTLAGVLGVTPGQLLDGSIELASLGPTLMVRGEVAAGVWKAASEWPESEWRSFTGSADITADLKHRFGLRVIGDSMDMIYPPGTTIECVSVFGNVEVVPGKRVVILRENDRREFEATVKELVEQDGAMWAVPRSHNPAHAPINLTKPEAGILETRIIAVVVSSIRPE